MTRIAPADPATVPEASRALADAHEAAGARMTNMKWTAARSPETLAMLLTWYPLFDRIAGFLGERRTHLLSHAISDRNECLICSTFFRRILIDAGEDLYGRLAARYGEQQIVELVGFGAIMVATNVFNDALGVPLDDHLQPYRKAA